MKLSATIKATKEFKTTIAVISSIIEEATFEANNKGIKFRGLEPSSIRYISVEFPADKFVKYECDNDLKFTIRTNEFLDIVNRAKNDEELTLEMDEKKRALQIFLGGKKHYVLALLAIEHDAPKPHFKFETKTVMKLSDLKDYVKDIAVVADNFIITTNESGEMILTGKGDAGEVKITADSRVSQEGHGELRSEYSIEFLITAMKSLGSGFEEVTLQHGNDLPLGLVFESPNMGNLLYVQAHKTV